MSALPVLPLIALRADHADGRERVLAIVPLRACARLHERVMDRLAFDIADRFEVAREAGEIEVALPVVSMAEVAKS